MLRRLTLLITCAVLSFASTTTIKYKLHETRPKYPDWSNIGNPSSNVVFPIRIGLTQSNLEKGPQWLREVSDPKSRKYGKYWTQDEIIQAFQPKAETHEAVQTWLISSGISKDRISVDVNHWMTFDASIGEAERLFKTQYSVFQHGPTGFTRVGCDSYSLPEAISEHVQLVTPTVHFHRPGRNAGYLNHGSNSDSNMRPVRRAAPTVSSSGSTFTGYGAAAVQSLVQQSTASCWSLTTPGCLRFLYSIPISYRNNSANSFAIPEFSPHNYQTSDLTGFNQLYSQRQINTFPTFDSVDGGQINQPVAGTIELEAVLDFQIANLVWPQQTTLYQGASKTTYNDVLDAIDSSYCTSSGWQNPYDYAQSQYCGVYTRPLVMSTSYDGNEVTWPLAYEVRQCNEYMKLGMLGTSVVYSAGDFGVAGYGGACLGPNANTPPFEPMFPSTCPYVTVVGATQVQGQTNIGSTSLTQPEQATSGFPSAGGFSNRFAMPWYQNISVPTYLRNYTPTYPAGTYNNSGNSRAYPDVSAAGWNYAIYIGGNPGYAYGTSASAPTFASILALINQQRLNLNKSPVGFVNPALYANPSLLNDITIGTNPGCGTQGFNASPGWDPVSGLGTPRFGAMLAYFLSL